MISLHVSLRNPLNTKQKLYIFSDVWTDMCVGVVCVIADLLAFKIVPLPHSIKRGGDWVVLHHHFQCLSSMFSLSSLFFLSLSLLSLSLSLFFFFFLNISLKTKILTCWKPWPTTCLPSCSWMKLEEMVVTVGYCVEGRQVGCSTKPIIGIFRASLMIMATFVSVKLKTRNDKLQKSQYKHQ